jgi:hypothetical protein
MRSKITGCNGPRVILSLSLAFLTVLSSLSLGSLGTGAYAQTEPSTQFGLNLNEVVYLDSYWTNNQATSSTTTTANPVKQEVAPGDGPSVLAVVLVNRGTYQLVDVVGSLTLPSDFTASGRNNGPNVAVSSYNLPVSAGQTFTMYFNVNVPNTVNVGQYLSTLNLTYNRVLETGGSHSNTIDVPFTLTGRVVLDAVARTQQLTPGTANNVTIEIVNKGSAPAAGVTVTVADASGSGGGITSVLSASAAAAAAGSNTTNASAPSLSQSSASGGSSSTVNVGSRVFSLGTIPVGGSGKITPVLFPSYSAGTSVQTMLLQISYVDAYGNRQTTSLPVGLVVSPNAAKSVLQIVPDNSDSVLTAGKVTDLNFTVTNTGKTPLNNVILSIASDSSSVKILGQSKWTFDTLDAGSSQQLSTKVFAATSVIGTPVSFPITSQYISGGQASTDSISLGAYITGEINIAIQGLTITYVNGIPNLSGNLLNMGNTVALYTTVGMVPPEFANSGAASNSSGSGSTSQNPFGFGFGGFGRHRGNNTSSFIGGSSNFGANTNGASTNSTNNILRPQSYQPQYLGDLDADSPLPFSIPLAVSRTGDNSTGTSGNTEAGITSGVYPVTLRITYTDDLKNPHTIIMAQNVFVRSDQGTRGQGSGGFGFGGRGGGDNGSFFGIPIMILAIIIAAIAVGIGVAVALRRRKSRSIAVQRSTDGDIESLLDESKERAGGKRK